MRLYHRWIFHKIYLLGVIFGIALMGACSAPQVTQGSISVSIQADGKAYQVQVPAGSDVEAALLIANLSVDELDRTDPPVFTVLSEGSEIRLIRVQEEYYIEQEIIPFEHQELRNETLAVGERLLSQPGVNGLQER